MRRDEELTRIEYLGQRLATQKPELRDYAMNVYADAIASLDFLAEHVFKGKDKTNLEFTRNFLLKLGEARYIRDHADVFTNLALKVGSTIRMIRAVREEEDE